MTTEHETGASLAINQYNLMYEDLPFKEGISIYDHGKIYRSRIDPRLVFQYNSAGDHFDVFFWRYE